jgi:NAD+ diphosphatase
MEMNFCRRCGTALTEKGGGLYVCTKSHRLYVSAAPTSGIFFLTPKNEVILSVRGIEPNKGKLDAFGGFIDAGETAEECLERELIEETGLTPDQYDKPEFLCTVTGKYPYDGEDRLVLFTVFVSQLKVGVVPVAADDVAEIRTLPLDEVAVGDIGNEDVKKAFQKLQQYVSDKM